MTELTVGRRGFLLAGGVAAAAISASPAVAKMMTPQDAIRRWRQMPVMPLWPQGTPEGGFKAQKLPGDWPAFFLRNTDQPELRIFRPEKPNGRALLVMPGGAYTFVSIGNEGLDIADRMTAKGYTVFVLSYRLPGEGWGHREDVPLQDAQRAMRLIRANAAKFGVDPAQVYAVGFSAGGHLAASLETAFDEDVYDPRDAADRQSARPAAVGLIYPVITHTPGIGHVESSLQLLGENPDLMVINRRSPAYHVTDKTPPTFLVHALDDPAVSPDNSLIMMQALRAAKRLCEAHFFEEGGHGFGPGDPALPVHSWIDLFAAWLDRQAG
ncbi:alpha/beta hydrolase [Altericroceibacterium endophyticum]|uniref:Alpha/beta hydrolase fold domain-containing protein n=1 Tax=Altericroceibacterium endophyticum TaxID=1808508 RepID=A0A6I4T971_9SPHN|nr:alpha/beta hydrolase [Altericroceibacterium endophyticum]MXO66420.1 alpha/beta hydrolase fold domain-containing protein [Altericroceibacterium endophyticum]